MTIQAAAIIIFLTVNGSMAGSLVLARSCWFAVIDAKQTEGARSNRALVNGLILDLVVASLSWLWRS